MLGFLCKEKLVEKAKTSCPGCSDPLPWRGFFPNIENFLPFLFLLETLWFCGAFWTDRLDFVADSSWPGILPNPS